MIILGIDPGSRKTGYAIIEKKGRQLKLLSSGVLRYDKEKEFLQRLGTIYQTIEEICQKYTPEEIAFESLIYVKSVTSLAKLAQARGAMVAACMGYGQARLFEYSPNLVKSSVSGHGHAKKEGVEKALGLIYGKVDFLTHDESDALAVATCHALNGGQQIKGSGARTLSVVFKNYQKEVS